MHASKFSQIRCLCPLWHAQHVYVVRGTLVHGMRYEVQGTWYVVQGTKYVVRDTRYEVQNTLYDY